MNGKSNVETYITMCKIDSQGKFAIWLRKFLDGRDREEDGRVFQKGGDICYLWLIHVEV